ncbi:zincin-like metallopeptidase domain-containing protein [Mucilaginibacter sp.]|uniref:ArdC family protein n=1 Tax=Mucilaginibacter sp. TaxID=1882438 RepID=UPI0032645462
METTQYNEVYTIVTNRIIEQLKHNIVPWQKPWTEAGYPVNLITNIPYRGMNVWMLASLGFAQNYFITWKQLKAAGGTLKKGEKGHLVVFWKPAPATDENDVQSTSDKPPVLRYYIVFNIAQTEGISHFVTASDSPYSVSTIGACDEILEMMSNAPKIKHSKQKAYYSPAKDYINMPKQETFKTTESYYSTLFHEVIHSTGHQSRLNRKGIVDNPDFGTEMYSQEELVAEIGACFLNSVVGIGAVEFDNSVSYINGWLEKLQKDNRVIVYASSQAQKAAEYILNVRPYEVAGAFQEQNTVEAH